MPKCWYHWCHKLPANTSFLSWGRYSLLNMIFKPHIYRMIPVTGHLHTRGSHFEGYNIDIGDVFPILCFTLFLFIVCNSTGDQRWIWKTPRRVIHESLTSHSHYHEEKSMKKCLVMLEFWFPTEIYWISEVNCQSQMKSDTPTSCKKSFHWWPNCSKISSWHIFVMAWKFNPIFEINILNKWSYDTSWGKMNKAHIL